MKRQPCDLRCRAITTSPKISCPLPLGAVSFVNTPFLAVSKSRSRISDVFHRGLTMQIENDGGSPLSSRQVQLELEKGAEGAMIGLIRSHPHDVLFRSSKIFDVG